MLFGLTCFIHQNASEFHGEPNGEAAYARGRQENAYLEVCHFFVSVFRGFEGVPVSHVG